MILRKICFAVVLFSVAQIDCWTLEFRNLTGKHIKFNAFKTAGERIVKDYEVVPFAQGSKDVHGWCTTKVEAWIEIKAKDISCETQFWVDASLVANDNYIECRKLLDIGNPELPVRLVMSIGTQNSCSDVKILVTQNSDGTFAMRQFNWRDNFNDFMDNLNKSFDIDKFAEKLMDAAGLKPDCIGSAALKIRDTTASLTKKIDALNDTLTPQLDSLSALANDLELLTQPGDSSKEKIQKTARDVQDGLKTITFKQSFIGAGDILANMSQSVAQLKEILKCTPSTVINRGFVPYLENAVTALTALQKNFTTLSSASYADPKNLFENVVKVAGKAGYNREGVAPVAQEIKDRVAAIKDGLVALKNAIKDYNDVILGLPEAANLLHGKVVDKLTPYQDDIKAAIAGTASGQGLGDIVTSLAQQAGVTEGPEGAVASVAISIGANMAETILVAATTTTSATQFKGLDWAKQAIAGPTKDTNLDKIFVPMPAMLRKLVEMLKNFVALVKANDTLKKDSDGRIKIQDLLMPQATENIITTNIQSNVDDLQDAIRGLTGKSRSKKTN